MRLIDRYVCREVFSHALLGLLIFTFILFVPQLVHLMELVVRNSGSLGRLGMLFLCTMPGLLIFTLPMGVLVGVLIGLGRLSADSELIVMSALGMGVRRVLIPVGARWRDMPNGTGDYAVGGSGGAKDAAQSGESDGRVRGFP